MHSRWETWGNRWDAWWDAPDHRVSRTLCAVAIGIGMALVVWGAWRVLLHAL